jgi:hypothetical protein
VLKNQLYEYEPRSVSYCPLLGVVQPALAFSCAKRIAREANASVRQRFRDTLNWQSRCVQEWGEVT